MAQSSGCKSFEYKTKIVRKTAQRPSRPDQPDPDKHENQPPRPDPPRIPPLNEESVVPLKYLSNFWRSLDLPLINCEIEPGLRWA